MGGFYPISLNLKGKNCLVIGGGKVAERKVQSLLSCGGKVTVVSPMLTPMLRQQAEKSEITYLAREYRETDIDGVFVVIGATDDTETNQKVAEDCFSRGILVNVVDNPDLCNFYVPAVVTRGDLSISVSTGGKSPMVARIIREELEKLYGDEYVVFLNIMGELRKELLANVPDEKLRREIFEKIARSDILNIIAHGQHDMAKGLIANVLSSCGVKS